MEPEDKVEVTVNGVSVSLFEAEDLAIVSIAGVRRELKWDEWLDLQKCVTTLKALYDLP